MSTSKFKGEFIRSKILLNPISKKMIQKESCSYTHFTFYDQELRIL